jgi:hypothetical protein
MSTETKDALLKLAQEGVKLAARAAELLLEDKRVEK